MRTEVFEPAFVEYVPKTLSPGVLYLALEHSTVVHLCACGCGLKVVTPLSPVHWQMTFDGDAVSLWPSIGNWQYPCRSHYWVRENRVEWAKAMSDTEIALLRRQDAGERDRYYASRSSENAVAPSEPPAHPPRGSWWRRLWLLTRT